MISELLMRSYFNNTVLDYLIVPGILICGIMMSVVIRTVVHHRIKAWIQRSKTPLDDLVSTHAEKAFVPLLIVGTLYMALRGLTLSAGIIKLLNGLWTVIVTVVFIRFIVDMLRVALEVYCLKGEEENLAKKQSLNGIITMVQLLLWGLGLVFLLDNLGFKVASVLAGLGVGGVAVALAAQAVLGDLFSYLAIFFDRPFEIGDFIIVGDYMGTVEHFGIKTTRIRSLGGEQLVFSNSDLTNSRVRNYKRMERRRIKFRLGVIYQTPLEKLKKIPVLLREIVESTPLTGFDRAHFAEYGDFSQIFEVIYYVETGDYNQYMDVQQEINFKIRAAFEAEAIEFAYPTQTLFVAQEKG